MVLAAIAAIFFLTPVASASEAEGDLGALASQCVRMSGPDRFNQGCVKVTGDSTDSGFFVERVSGGMVTEPDVRILCDVKVELFGIFANNVHYNAKGVAPCKPNITYFEQFPRAEFKKGSLLCAKVTYGSMATSEPACYTIPN